MSILNFDVIDPSIDYALNEDIGDGDITTNAVIPGEMQTTATMTAKADGVVAGLPVAERVFRKLNPDIEWTTYIEDGSFVKKGDVLVQVKGSFRALLTGERLALNFLQRMSGIASETSRYVKAVEEYKTEILDTRKTVPGLRLLDKYAVKMGGGTNHRIGLYDMVMIKDNHIKVAGGITEAVEAIRPTISDNIKIEVETTNLEEVKEAIAAGADIIMLDNMDNETMKRAVELVNGRAKVEASGNMTLERLKGVAATGVDFISIGALTHSVTALDISMNIDVNQK
ncbi:carboxylating nicotinate-nucleotide diphosphorylase [Prolixibacter denitrificans]|uniref:Probable nicotinate-nucleotide pyrophosphorylase [carboxylating] n=1 Tax=Prolixibacter denitrificans TaxID=1541063 RepID=A0A2P8CIJ5_9BACT|nr:carboxylating nicotinate-nucleotide diphosphorylase [Prolixibacter denitrificans]PSK84784.1 nicotinate-nucleotide pyrophosphorylase (carboxylating) [Prolixibacter denitrificans]GET20949.1 nicotinate-nucleotide diphosphorylase (carboxylating) [Prolixibacter denitrificans]